MDNLDERLEIVEIILFFDRHWIPPFLNNLSVVYYLLQDCFPDLNEQEIREMYDRFQDYMTWEHLIAFDYDQILILDFTEEQARALVPYFRTLEYYISLLRKGKAELVAICEEKKMMFVQNNIIKYYFQGQGFNNRFQALIWT